MPKDNKEKKVQEDLKESISEVSNNLDENNQVAIIEKEGEGGLHELDHDLEFENAERKDFLKLLQTLTQQFSPTIFKSVRKLYEHFEAIIQHEIESAENKFIIDGGKKEDFEFRTPSDFIKFQQLFHDYSRQLKIRFSESEKEKNENLKRKEELLEALRRLSEEAETPNSFKKFKDLQKEWNSIGKVPGPKTSEIWARYHALVDIFYNNRKLYIDLIDLDRKRNLELKEQLCEKLRQLTDQPFSNKLLSDLNNYHDEFKHIGPVPRDQQELIWEKFKSYSDQLYERKKEFNQKNQEKLDANLMLKQQIVDVLMDIALQDLQTPKIWNEKIALVLQKSEEWKKIGPIPKEKTQEINMLFWNNYKLFFQKKSGYFKNLDREKAANLKLKVSLCEKAESLFNENWENNLENVKQLQSEWKEIGPVPIKHREKIFNRFKAACDQFFQKRKETQNEKNQELHHNLERKRALCVKMEQLMKSKPGVEQIIAAIDEFKNSWAEIGMVPISDKNAIQYKYSDTLQKLLKASGLSGKEINIQTLKLELKELKNDPEAINQLAKKEQGLKKKLQALENEASTLRNNLGLFTRPSKSGNSILAQYENQLAGLDDDIKNIKDQLSLIKNVG